MSLKGYKINDISTGEMLDMTLTKQEIAEIVKMLLEKYHADYAILFGTYAWCDATEDSDIDLIVFDGVNLKRWSPL